MRITAGTHRNRKLLVPKGKAVRPTPEAQRERLFNMVQHLVEEAEVLDLYAGSGALSFEALSRGATSATAIEKSRESIRCIRSNAETLSFSDQLTLHCGDVLTLLPKLARRNRQFNLIFADPPFEEKRNEQYLTQDTLETIDRLGLLAPGGICFIEHATHLPLNEEPLQRLVRVSSRKTGDSTIDRFEIREESSSNF